MIKFGTDQVSREEICVFLPVGRFQYIPVVSALPPSPTSNVCIAKIQGTIRRDVQRRFVQTLHLVESGNVMDPLCGTSPYSI